MRRDVKDNETDGMWHLDDKELKEELDQFLVKYPDEEQIDATISTLRQYVPQKGRVRSMERLHALVKRSAAEVSLISPAYWVLSVLLFVLGYAMTTVSTDAPLTMFIVLGSLPFIIGVSEVVKGREQGMLEMEMSCRHSSHEVMLSRLFIIGAYNVLLNGVLIIGFVPVNARVSLWEMILVSLTAFTIFAAVSLAVLSRLRGRNAPITIISIWFVTMVALASNYTWIEKYVHGSLLFQGAVLVTGVGLFLMQAKQLAKRFSTFEEEEYIESDR
ncbi:hypothetical protein [Alteribacter keqinensis]|uniref:Uncharacterized protein n=1 Tax=Alteribacter keqinensis TaxID=2483800 RepID=A0A3M7TP00_9BACI|nr:hypothetical protein [Alteribacter keqinensis]RNA67118.1 hypothetical protein EBO34_18190 [Alteribacter keqinensis]